MFLWACGELLATCLKMEVLGVGHGCLQFLLYSLMWLDYHWQQCIRAPVYPHSCLHFIFFDLQYNGCEVLFYCCFNLLLNVVRLGLGVINYPGFFFCLRVNILFLFFFGDGGGGVSLRIWILFLVSYKYYKSLVGFTVYGNTN